MQISLKQKDIVAALMLYISTQGIKLEGKTFDTTFTAGRGGTGTTVEIDIADCAIPDLGADDNATVQKAEAGLKLVPAVAVPEAATAAIEAVAAVPTETGPVSEDAGNEVATAEPAPTPEKKTSLFA